MTGVPSQTLPHHVPIDDSVSLPPESAAAAGSSHCPPATDTDRNACSAKSAALREPGPSNEHSHSAMTRTPDKSLFRANTIAPSPPMVSTTRSRAPSSSLSAEILPNSRTEGLFGVGSQTHGRSALTLQHKTSSSSLKPVSRTPSVKQAIAHTVGSAASSNYPSPIISAMGDVTPLPSPLLSNHSPGPWKQLRARSASREGALSPIMHDSVLVTASGESITTALAHQSKRKAYAGLNLGQCQEQSSGKYEHARNRSISEYIPDPRGIPKRHTTVSGPRGKNEGGPENTEAQIRREPHLSESRGITSATRPPTPPPSESSQSTDGSAARKLRYEYFEARGRHDMKLRRWRAIADLGQGTFSRVVLATSQMTPDSETGGGERHGREEDAPHAPGIPSSQLDRKTLVAVKVCEHGPRGGASENRIEMSLKRELEIMQSINHPSLVRLRAWNIEPTRALLVLGYCPGGDLFDVATTYRGSLSAPLLRRIFAELVGAVRYLHERRIVHRDIKLENVLVNMAPTDLARHDEDWDTYPYSIVTLTDLGLSRRVADDEKLETRCGSDDYAAPEVILGQPYDGRATDAWSLGVLLYALLESRLPFDPHPNASEAQRMRSRTSHRIARVEWSWIKFAGDDGDHEANEAKFEAEGLKGAMEITEGLLKRARSRWPLEKVAEHPWVTGGIQVEGGLVFREEEEGEVVS